LFEEDVMPAVAHPIAGLDQYLTALEVLTSVGTQLDADALWDCVLDASDPPRALDDVVGMLCQQARVATQLAAAAEALCAALVAEHYHLHR
jgi:hypothetical protein